MMMPVARWSVNAFLRASSIRVELAYSFQDTTTILHTKPSESTATSAHGVIEWVKTAANNVA